MCHRSCQSLSVVSSVCLGTRVSFVSMAILMLAPLMHFTMHCLHMIHPRASRAVQALSSSSVSRKFLPTCRLQMILCTQRRRQKRSKQYKLLLPHFPAGFHSIETLCGLDHRHCRHMVHKHKHTYAHAHVIPCLKEGGQGKSFV